MNVRLLSLLIIVLIANAANAVDYWKPRVKDEFDVIFEQADEKNTVVETQVEEVVEKPEEPKVKTYKDLKSTPFKLQDGSKGKFEKVVVFSCENVSKKRFLFNKKQTSQCWIQNVKDAAKIAEKIGIEQFKQKSAAFEICAEPITSVKSCDPKKLRNF
jgi:hypothetical protein